MFFVFPRCLAKASLAALLVAFGASITEAQPKPGLHFSPNPAVVCKDNGAFEVFALGANSALWHNWQERCNGDFQHDWSSLGMAYLYQVVATTNANGFVRVFAVGCDMNVYTASCQPNFAWSSWLKLDGGVTAIASGNYPDGRIALFGISTNKSLVRCWQTSPNGNFGKWAGLDGAGLAGGLVAGNNADGRLQAFMVASDNTVRSIFQTASGGWDWRKMNASISTNSDLALARDADGRMEVFGIGTDGALWHSWQLEPNGGWPAFTSMGGTELARKVAATSGANGCLQVFATDGQGSIYTATQATAGGGWGKLIKLAGSGYRNLAVGRNPDGRIEIFSRGSDARIWRCVQREPNGGWKSWSRLGNLTFE